MVSAAIPVRREPREIHLTRGSAQDGVNVGQTERWISVAGGSLLALYGLSEGNLTGLGLAALGGGLLYRGLTGHCPMYCALDISTEKHSEFAAVAAGRGFKVTRAVTVQASPDELYRQWRHFDNLPHFMSHLVSVQAEGERSHWVAKAPAGMTVQWDAEIVTDEPNRVIAWRSLEGSQIATAGSVHFTPLPGGHGTEVRVVLKYDLPGGQLGSWLAWLFGESPEQQIRDDLQRFKQWIEAGEFAGVGGQPGSRY